MTWFKVDDTLAHHAKAVAAGNAAMGLWVRAGAWCSQQLTDGFVPDHMARSLGSAREIAALVRVGLWAAEEGGYQFHQWGGRNPTRVEVETRRAEDAKRKAEARAKAKKSREQQHLRAVPDGTDP